MAGLWRSNSTLDVERGRNRTQTETVQAAPRQAQGILELLNSPAAREALQGSDFARWRGVPVSPAGGYFELAPLRSVNNFARGLRSVFGGSTSKREAYIPQHGFYRLNYVLVAVVPHVEHSDPGEVTVQLVENTNPTRAVDGQELTARLADGTFVFAAAPTYDIVLEQASMLVEGEPAGVVQRMFGIRTSVMGSLTTGSAVSIYPIWSAEFPIQGATFNYVAPSIVHIDRFNRSVATEIDVLRRRFSLMRPLRTARSRESFQAGRMSLDVARPSVVRPPPVDPQAEGGIHVNSPTSEQSQGEDRVPRAGLASGTSVGEGANHEFISGAVKSTAPVRQI